MLYQNMTCEENLTFFGRMYEDWITLAGGVDGVLTQMGLEARRLQRVRTLSHGMQKRLVYGPGGAARPSHSANG